MNQPINQLISQPAFTVPEKKTKKKTRQEQEIKVSRITAQGKEKKL